MESVVIADIGSAFTKTALLGNVEGSLRLLAASQAPTSSAPPQADVLDGVRLGVELLQVSTGCRLLQGDFLLSPAQPNGNGADYFLATSSAGEALTLVVIVADARSASAAGFTSAASRLLSTPINLDIVSLSGDTRVTGARLIQWQVTPLDAVVFVPSPKPPKDLAPRVNELVQFLSSAARRKGVNRLPLFYLGTQEDLDDQELLPSEDLAWQPLVAGDDPGIDELSGLAPHLNRLYEERQEQLVPGLKALRQHLAAPLQSGPQALGAAADFLARDRDAYTLVIDVGASTTTAVSSDGRSVEWGIASGTGAGAPLLIHAAGTASVTRWLPYPCSAAQLDEAAMNRALFPCAMPATNDDLQLDHALAIEAIRLALSPRDRQRADAAGILVVATGGLFRGAPNPGQVALSLLTALQPVGRTSLLLDRFGVLQPAAVLSQHEPEIVRRFLDDDVLERLGDGVGVRGKARDGEPALHVRVLDGPEAGRDFPVAAGSIEVLPVDAGHTVTLDVKPVGRLSVGRRPGEGLRAEVFQGGSVGVILDARPRPLTLPSSMPDRVAKLAAWMEAFHAS